jgi:predicted aspartyl protease
VQYKKSDKPNPDGLKCYKCKKPGHKSTECRVRLHNSHIAESDESEHSVRNHKSNLAWADEEPEIVNMINISSIADTKANKLMHVEAKINDKNVISCIDTGAVISITSLNIANECGLKLNKDETEVLLADNSICKIDGITEPVTVEINDNRSEMTFLVINNGSKTTLLGQDWLQNSKAMLWPVKNQVFHLKMKKLSSMTTKFKLISKIIFKIE